MASIFCELSENWSAGAFGPGADDARDSGFAWTLLPRHGKRPARFFGRVLLRTDNRAAAQPARLPCWMDVQAYELFDRGFAVGVRHVAAEDDRTLFQDVWQAASAAGIKATLRGHDVARCTACAVLPGEGAALRQAWQDLLGAMFGADPSA